MTAQRHRLLANRHSHYRQAHHAPVVRGLLPDIGEKIACRSRGIYPQPLYATFPPGRPTASLRLLVCRIRPTLRDGQ